MATYDLNTTIPSKIAKGDILNYPYTQSVATNITLPKGTYKLEVWGAQGAKYSGAISGKGGYSYGTLILNTDTNIYLTAGQQGTTPKGYSVSEGGWPDGGSSYSYDEPRCSGGGSSDIRIGENSIYARIIVAGGGGGNLPSSSAYTYTPGSGGGIYGIGGTSQQGSSFYTSGFGGEPTSGGAGPDIYSTYQPGDFALGGGWLSGTYTLCGGGGGWYGGGYGNPGGGGSGYVYTSSTASQYPSECLLNSSYYLINAETIDGNNTFTDYSGSTVTGHEGNGACRITVLSLPIPPPVIWFKNSDNIWQKMN